MTGGARVAAVAAVAVFALVPEARAAALDRLGLAASSAPTSAGVAGGRAAERQVGEPYVFGADGPNSWDCSGLVIGAWHAAGARWPDSTADGLYRHWPRVPLRSARPGDLLVWDWGSGSRVPGADHVAIVTTRGRFVEAPQRGVPVRIRKLAGAHPTAVVRPGLKW